MAFDILLTVPIGVEQSDKELLNALRRASPQLAQLEVASIVSRTPYRTGALQGSITGDSSTGEVSGNRTVTLVSLYATDEYQLIEWGRVYVGYQEYLPLGQSTYTPQKAQMFYRVGSEDLPQIAGWAWSAAQQGVDAIESLPVETKSA